VGGFIDRARERQRLLKSYQTDQRLIASAPFWRAAGKSQRLTASRFSMIAPSRQQAVEALEERFRHLAADEGFAVTAIQDLQADAPAGTVRIRADAELTLTQLCDSLRRIETEGAYVVVDYLSISADRALVTGRAAPLDIRLEFSAAYRPTGTTSP
jgi:hypothetical protein